MSSAFSGFPFLGGWVLIGWVEWTAAGSFVVSSFCVAGWLVGGCQLLVGWLLGWLAGWLALAGRWMAAMVGWVASMAGWVASMGGWVASMGGCLGATEVAQHDGKALEE